MKRNVLLIFLPLVFASSVSLAQITLSLGSANLHAGKTGLGIDGIAGSPNLLLKVFFSSQVAGQVILGVSIDSPGGSAPVGFTKVTGTELRGGLSLIFHMTNDQVSPYVGIECIYQAMNEWGFFTREPDVKSSIQAGAIFGAEYFIIERFSLGIKQSLGADVEFKRDVPKEETDVKFATATVMTGRFYFN